MIRILEYANILNWNGKEQILKEEKKLIEEKSSILSALSSPARLCIVKTLVESGEKNVSEFLDCMDLSQSNISQHLAKLRDMGIIYSRKDGNKVYYNCDRADIKLLINTIFMEVKI